ncbi:YaiI/YqxD family protein [Alloalcanivorax mobilis]|uniref:YaiI/YqxD family protein n=1 Tax=Alloalcanivorax mobilis TaxID=2019569 RepID=UPI000C78B701|nr:YaiI/YqxD family protein [Alloalcanivorax mobilis]|tara:strand:+ start:35160 stop:35603 length:444 start_codon:yes stop_codon:yes gene_type:complete
MNLWIDADACPAVIREVLFRAATRRGIDTTLVANHFIRTPRSPHIRAVQVAAGFDQADDYIAEQVQPGDLVITGDVPLAARVVDSGGTALNPRGTLYDTETIREHLGRRDFMEELRSTGVQTGGPASLSKSDVQTFANALDRFLARR